MKPTPFHLAFTILILIVSVGFLAAMNPILNLWTSNGTYHIADNNGEDVTFGFVTDSTDPMTTFTVTVNKDARGLRTFYPLGAVNEGEKVFIIRIYAKIKPNNEGVYNTWVFPTERFEGFKSLNISISRYSGTFGLVADDSGRTDTVGYVREYSTSQDGVFHALPLDNKIPYYLTFVSGKTPVVGDNIKFTVIRIHLSSKMETWWSINFIH